MTFAQRLYHLDALRAFCMLYGLLVHGATLGANPLFTAIQLSSDHFRMAAFFLISGYFTALMHTRVSMNWVANRAQVVLLPFFTAFLFLNPLTWYLIYHWRGHGRSFGSWIDHLAISGPPPDLFLHLWFLLALFSYAVLTPYILRLWRARPVARMVDIAAQWRLAPAVAALGVGLAMTALRSVHDLVIEDLVPERLGFPVMASFNYFAFFALGAGAFVHRALFERLHSLAWATLAVAATVYLFAGAMADEWPRSIQRIVYWAARGATILAIVMALLWTARRFVSQPSSLLATLTSSVYTFYLFHYAFIYLVAALLLPLGLGPLGVFLIVMTLGFPLLLRLHTGVIARSPLLMLMLNGRALQPVHRPA